MERVTSVSNYCSFLFLKKKKSENIKQTRKSNQKGFKQLGWFADKLLCNITSGLGGLVQAPLPQACLLSGRGWDGQW